MVPPYKTSNPVKHGLVLVRKLYHSGGVQAKLRERVCFLREKRKFGKNYLKTARIFTSSPVPWGPAFRRRSRPARCRWRRPRCCRPCGPWRRWRARRRLSQTAKSSSLLSTTFTKPTGTPMTSAGRSPASISSAMVKRAVGALPTARMAPGCSARGPVHGSHGAGGARRLWPRRRPPGPPCSRAHCRPAFSGPAS